MLERFALNCMRIVYYGIMGFAIGTAFALCSAKHAKAADITKMYKIAIIDTGFTPLPFNGTGFKICKSGHFDYATDTPTVGEDTIGHGSYVTALADGHAQTENICFLIYKVFGGQSSIESVNKAMISAYKAGAKAINMSLSISKYEKRTHAIVKAITNRGVKMFVSAGNASTNMNTYCNSYPACFKGINKNMIIVGSTDYYRERASYSNYGFSIDVWEYGDLGRSRGTSFAAPRALGNYVKTLKLDGEK